MAEFGRKLREAREQQGFTFEYVEEETKIRKLYIKALEEENFSILPPQVYANGFVKRYALFLNLDVEAFSREFKELAYGKEEPEELPPMPIKPEKEPLLSKMPVRNIALAAVFLIVAIWAGNYLVGYFTRDTDRANVIKPPAAEDKNDSQTGDKTPTPAPVPPQASDKLNLTVKVKPQQKSWLLIRVDGEQKLQGILTSDQQQSFAANDSIYIKAGNAAAVEIYINNKLQEPLGGTGEVKEKEFKNGGKY